MTGLHDDSQRDGAVCVRGAFSAAETALVERGIERNLAEPSERANVAGRPDDPGRFFEDFCNWQRIPEFERFIRQSPAAAIAGELVGSRRVRLFHDQCSRCTPPAAGEAPAGLLGALPRRRRTHVARPWKTSPEFPGLADELPPDVPMEHELFPVLRPPVD